MEKRPVNKLLTIVGGIFLLSSSTLYAQTNTTSQTENVQGTTATTVNQDLEDTLSLKNHKHLDEIIVIGYGTQKSKDLTAPIVTVSAEEISKHTTGNAIQGLAGAIAGVQIQSNSQPGSGANVRIRGVGSFGTSGPLYVVDGMFYDNINFLNNDDIATMTVLKDASSSAIYGVRAANGVVIITTKKGSINARPRYTYDGYAGVQVATNVLKMADASLYKQVALAKGDNSYLQQSINLYGGDLATLTPSTNTNWYNELLRPAFMQNHSLSIAGGTEKMSHNFSLNYFGQQGIMKGSQNDYERINVRYKTDYKPNQYFNIGGGVIVSNVTLNTPNNTAWYDAYVSPPIYPVYDENNTYASPIPFAAGTSIGLANTYANPVATATYNNNNTQGIQVLPSAYMDINFIPNKLTWRSAYSQDIGVSMNRQYTPHFTVVPGAQGNTQSSLTKSNSIYNKFIIDNTLTFQDHIKDHHFSVMVGNSVRIENYRYLSGTGYNVPDSNTAYWYLINSNSTTRTVTDDGFTYNGLSFFARATYDYQNKYLLTATFRADGSSKYQQKWGYFPSVGIGWVMTEENWMKHQKLISFLKLRGSYGQLGNDAVEASLGQSTYTTITPGALFGNSVLPAYTILNNFSYLKWEVIEEFDLGFDVNFFKDRLSASFDWYRRVTKNAVVTTPVPNSTSTITTNNGQILNTGFEVSLQWADQIGDFGYWIGGNITTLKNKVLALNGQDQIISGYTIRKVGEPIDAFYGLKVVGVYQNQTEIDNDPTIANMSAGDKANIKPGYFKYDDINGDGTITADDRTILGSKLPSLMYGFNLGVRWKGLEVSMAFQGTAGNTVYNQNRTWTGLYAGSNYDADYASNMWTGEGSTNRYPSAEATTQQWSVNRDQPNSFFMENAWFLRIQNIQVAYTYKPKSIKGKELPSFRFSLTAETPYTFFNYNGFNPNIFSGVDNQVYPTAAVYSFGLKIIY